MARLRLGLALGGGSARGWAHLGVIDALTELGIRPDIVCGTSIGALVGAVYVTGRLDALRARAEKMTWRDGVKMLDLRIARGGLIDGAKIRAFLDQLRCTGDIETLATPFAAVATDIENGGEVWLRSGPIGDAVRASIGLPGIFLPCAREGRWLLDGGLVNPVPVSLCRALCADVVIAVDVNSSRMIPAKAGMPSYFDALARSVTIMQVQITRARLASEPADILLVPELGDVGPFQFDRAYDSIAEGRACVARSRDALVALLTR